MTTRSVSGDISEGGGSAPAKATNSLENPTTTVAENVSYDGGEGAVSNSSALEQGRGVGGRRESAGEEATRTEEYAPQQSTVREVRDVCVWEGGERGGGGKREGGGERSTGIGSGKHVLSMSIYLQQDVCWGIEVPERTRAALLSLAEACVRTDSLE